MKLSKTLLQAIAVGITMSATNSCTMFEDTKDVHFKNCSDTCEVDHAKEKKEIIPFCCPACGMG